MLLAELADFVIHYWLCGQLTGVAMELEPEGYLITVGRSCGVVFMRWVMPQ